MKKVTIVSFPWRSDIPYKFINELILILSPISDRVNIIDGKSNSLNRNVGSNIFLFDIGLQQHYIREVQPQLFSKVYWIFKSLKAQLKMSIQLIKIKDETDLVILYLCYPYHIFPTIVTKVLGIKIIEVLTRSSNVVDEKTIYSRLLRIQEKYIFRLLDGVSPETECLVGGYGPKLLWNKTLAMGARFIDTDVYKKNKDLDVRENVIGFIGRLKKEKGIDTFVKAIPHIIKTKNDVKFVIIGTGDLFDWVQMECKALKNEYGAEIEVTGYVEEKDISHYLNNIKLLVLPTRHQEGLPTTALESMSCSTPILANPAGGLVGLIDDCVNGFIIHGDTSEEIANQIVNILARGDLNQIGQRAREEIINKYSYRNAMERWENILNSC